MVAAFTNSGFDFHTLVLEVSANQTLMLMGEALRQIMERHMSLIDVDILERETPEAQLQRQRAGFKSQERLAEFIETGDGPGAVCFRRRSSSWAIG